MNTDLVMILIYAGTCYAFYCLYREYLDSLVPPAVVHVAGSASSEPDKKD